MTNIGLPRGAWRGMTLALMLMIVAGRAAAGSPLDTNSIQSALGLSGKMMPGGVYRVSLPRSDLHVCVDGIPLQTAFALGGYAVYEPTAAGALVMGDLPLLQSEVTAVQASLLRSGFDITALHNHLLRDTPHIMYMHYMKTGDPVAISRELRDALKSTGMPFAPHAARPPTVFSYASQIDTALNVKGNAHDGIYSVSIARPEKIMEAGNVLPAAMGVATSVNFQTAGTGRIATTGDFVLTADQVQPVARALRAHGIEVTALHQHLIGADPMLYFMHFWAAGKPEAVLPALRAAFDVLQTTGP